MTLLWVYNKMYFAFKEMLLKQIYKSECTLQKNHRTVILMTYSFFEIKHGWMVIGHALC
jgi:hypothetical protein